MPTGDDWLDTLLALDGVRFFIDPAGLYVVRFVAKRVEASAERPHGISYSIKLHGSGGERLVGFDNAHAVATQAGPAGRQRKLRDHRHRLSTIRPYDYRDAAGLLADFWEEVDRMLRERGVLP